MPRGFPRSDYLERTARAQALMAERELALLWYSTEAEIRYFTGFLTQFWESPTRPWYLLIPAAGHPVAVIPGIGAALMGETWIADIRTWSAPSPGDDGESLLADAIAELSPPSGRIGTRMGIESLVRMPLDQLRGLERAVAPRTIVDDGGIAARLRAVKSEAEIDKIRTACTIAGHAFARVPDFAREGTPLDQVFRRFQAICLEEGADRVAYTAGGAGVDGYADVISPPGETPLVKGDLVMIDTGVVHDGYFADYDRNYSVGKPSEPVRRAHDLLYAATEAALAIARPGTTAAELYHAMATTLPGETEGGRMGHGLGMQLTEGVSLIPQDDTVLEEGMVITLEPGMETVPGRIMVHEENIVIRADGPEMLSPRAPAELPVLETRT